MSTEITATRRDTEDSVTVTYELGEGLADAIELFGEDVVFNRFKSMAIIDVQAKCRSMMVDSTNKEGDVISKAKSQGEIQEVLDNWKLGLKKVSRKSPKEKVLDLLSGMSAEEKAAFIAEMADS